ncbi:MAG: hypothetical protein N2235_14440, partial [Fischerella sp.]|nr:hypothetical protein [Fischerella sp.]
SDCSDGCFSIPLVTVKQGKRQKPYTTTTQLLHPCCSTRYVGYLFFNFLVCDQLSVTALTPFSFGKRLAGQTAQLLRR